MNGGSAAEIREGEGGPSVTTVSGAQQTEEGAMLRDRQELAVAKGPTARGEVAPEHDNFCKKWTGHGALEFVVQFDDSRRGRGSAAGWVDSLERDDEIHAAVGFDVGVT